MNEVKDVPVNRYPVTLDGDDIICYAAFHESLLKVNESWGETYAKVCEEGIEPTGETQASMFTSIR